MELADVAADYDVILAVEPHIGNALDTPEKSVWLMEQSSHPNLKLNFDISHFAVAGMDTVHCVNLCAPHVAHIHVKDGRMVDGELEFLLPGEGDFDYQEYFRAVAAAGITVPVVVEVSGMVWRLPDYDPWAAAESSFRALDEGRRQGTISP